MTRERPALTVPQQRRRIERLQNCIKDLRAFDITAVRNRNPPEAQALENSIDEALSAAFGHGTVEYQRYKSATELDQGPTYTPSMVAMAGAPRGSRPDVSAMQSQEAQQYLSQGVRRSIVLITQAIRALESEIDDQDVEADQARTPTQVGGRPPADWWDDLIIDICFKHFRGELKPKTQAEVARAMQAWMTEHGHEAADSTVRVRARKVWNAIQQDAEN
jgi:hypothetical protein